MPPRIASMLEAAEIYGRVLTLEECIAIMRTVDFGAVASYLAVITRFTEVAFESAPFQVAGHINHVGSLLGFMFAPPCRDRAIHIAGQIRGPFSPVCLQALVATAELSGRFSPRTGRSTQLDGAERTTISHVLTSFQASTFSPRFLTTIQANPEWGNLPQETIEEFIRNMVGVNPSRPYANSLARLYAYAREPSIAALFQARTGRPLGAWFADNFALSPDDYLLDAFLASSVGARFSLDRPSTSDLVFQPEIFFQALPAETVRQISALLAVATIPESTWATLQRRSTTLADLLYESNQLHATPIIDFGDRRLIFSRTLLSNLFAWGLPHCSLNAVRQRQSVPLRGDQVQAVRAEFGLLFEGYVQWLFRQWFSDRNVAIHSSYEARAGGQWCERDLAIVSQDTAFVFEIKGNVADIAFRTTGSFDGLAKFVEAAARQAYLTADAFLSGNVRTASRQPIPPVSRVIPIAIVYDPIPLNLFTADHFEPWLERRAGLPLFTPTANRAAVQLMSIHELESAEALLRLDVSPLRLLHAILLRSQRRDLRFDGLKTLADQRHYAALPAPVRNLTFDANQFLEEAARRLLGSSRVS